MNKKIFAAIAATVAAGVLPAVANASLVLDTGTPTGGSYYVLSTGEFFAAEFSLTAGESINQVAAYLSQGTGALNANFTFDIYSDNNGAFLNTKYANLSGNGLLDYSATGTYTTNGGWNSLTLSTPWTASTTGNYWLAVQVSTSTSNYTRGVDLQSEASSTTGTAPAEAFAYYSTSGTSGYYKTSGAPAVGLQVSAVPLPAGLPLLVTGLAGLGVLALRRRQA